MSPEEYAKAVRELIERAALDSVCIYAIPSGDGGHRLFSGYLFNEIGEDDVLIADVSL